MIKKLLLLLFTIALITACSPSNAPSAGPTPDVAVVRTSAASTVVSQFTLTAAAFTPTTTSSLPTETPIPQVTGTVTVQPVAQVTNDQGTTVALCDSLSVDLATVDVNIPDGTSMSPGQDFVKTWKVKNSGSCTWDANYKLVYAGYADKMSGQWQPLTQVVQPGQEVELSVQFKAPDQIGEYLSAWQMSNPRGITFPAAIYVEIIVQ
jgi:hypothetical protein